MNLQLLNAFVAVMRRGTFAAVARDQNVDPSSISRAVAELERELGVRLFHRTTRKLTPTEAGQVYFNRVEPLIEEFEAATLQAIDAGQKPKGTLRVAAPVSFSLLNIVPLLPELAETYPDLSLDLTLTDSVPNLVDERLDVALRLGPLHDSGLVAQQLLPMVMRACASPAYLTKHGKPKVPQDLQQHDCLLLNMPGFGAEWRFCHRNGEVKSLEVAGRFRTSNAIALKECALAGMGVILQASWIVGRDMREGRLVDLFPDWEITAATFPTPAMWLLYPTASYVPLKTRVFVEFLRSRIEAPL